MVGLWVNCLGGNELGWRSENGVIFPKGSELYARLTFALQNGAVLSVFGAVSLHCGSRMKGIWALDLMNGVGEGDSGVFLGF